VFARSSKRGPTAFKRAVKCRSPTGGRVPAGRSAWPARQQVAIAICGRLLGEPRDESDAVDAARNTQLIGEQITPYRYSPEETGIEGDQVINEGPKRMSDTVPRRENMIKLR